MIIQGHELEEWRKRFSIIFCQYIYKQNHTLKDIQKLSEEFMNYLLSQKISYYDFLEGRKIDLYDHLIFTAMLSLETGIHFGMKDKQLKDLFFGGLIHDIGLRFVNVTYEDRSMDSMSANEIYELKNHTTMGFAAIEREDWIPHIVKTLVLSHHECQDGTGYPLKQRNEDLECKIIQVCDTVDRILSGIQEKQGTPEEALKMLETYRGTKYDSEITDHIINLLK